MITNPYLPELRQLFIKYNVVLAYLFGSHATGRARASSDVDIAVLLAPTVPSDDFFDVRLALTDDLMVLFKRDVDVAILNRVSALLAYQVVRQGTLLYEDPVTHPAQNFVIFTIKYYADTEHFRQINQRRLEAHLEQYRARRNLAQEKAHVTS